MSSEVSYTIKRLLAADLKVSFARFKIKRLPLISIRFSVTLQNCWIRRLLANNSGSQSIFWWVSMLNQLNERRRASNWKLDLWMVSFYLNSVNLETFRITRNLFNSIDETDWSMQMAEEIYANEWECPHCHSISNMTNIQKLQHAKGKPKIQWLK